MNDDNDNRCAYRDDDDVDDADVGDKMIMVGSQTPHMYRVGQKIRTVF